MTETYTDTWGKSVRKLILKSFVCDEKQIYLLNPDFQSLEFVEEGEKPDSIAIYSEGFHLEDADQKIVDAYNRTKASVTAIDPVIRANPQKYYISLRGRRNFAFIKPLKHKMNIVIMLPIEEGKDIIKAHKVSELSEGIQRFYSGPCFNASVESPEKLEEVIKALAKAYERQKRA